MIPFRITFLSPSFNQTLINNGPLKRPPTITPPSRFTPHFLADEGCRADGLNLYGQSTLVAQYNGRG